jgi:hypothetical protein
MEKNYFKILYVFVLSSYLAVGQNDYANLQTCNSPQVDYASSVPANNQAYWDVNFSVVENPDNIDTANPNVFSVKGNNNANHYISFILPNPISPTAGDTFSLRFYAPNAGSLNTGTGRVIVKFWNSSLGLNTNIRQFIVNKTGGIWESITGNIDDAQSATESFDRIAILPHNTSQETGTFDPLYLDDFVISSDQSYEVISLDTGSSWIHYPDLAQTNYASLVESDMTITSNYDNIPEACPNSGSSVVTKLTRGAGVQSRVSYTFNGPINQDNAIFKMRLYPISGTARVYALLRTSTDNGVDQLISPVVNYSSGVWHDITFDFSVLTAGATGDVYNALNIRIDWNLATTTENNEYLIDALQGPAAVLSANDHYSSLDVGLKLNPVTAYLSLNQEVEMAEIINIIGKTVLKFEKNASTYDISSLPKGIYFVRISKNNRNQVLKFVKK